MNNLEHAAKKRARILLRVSSNQQLDANGDLTTQRQIITDYINQHNDWILDTKEYFEGGISGYKNAISDRHALQDALQDAKNKEYDILVVYKDDRIGRRMDEAPLYIFDLKKANVDVYSVKDGLLTPSNEETINKLMLYLRYFTAEKSSSDTGMRVKDTAKQLVKQGKFMGGKAPYGYELKLSGDISKHGRALKHPVIVPYQAEIVKYIYNLSLNKEFGSTKIAQVLNQHEIYKTQAPNDKWRSGTITSILTNPLYAGYTSYNRRQHVGGKYVNLHHEDWIVAEKPNPDLIIIDEQMWQKVQEKRALRRQKYEKSEINKNATIITRNDGLLSLIDVLYCGYCGAKMINGTKYDYWTIKGTGERRASRVPCYKCSKENEGIPHEQQSRYRAERIEPIIYSCIVDKLDFILSREDAFKQAILNNNLERKKMDTKLKKESQELEKIRLDIDTLREQIPSAIRGECILSLNDLNMALNTVQEKEQKKLSQINELQEEIKNCNVAIQNWDEIQDSIPSWQEILLSTDTPTKRALVIKLIDRIYIKKNEINIKFKINLNDFFKQPRINEHFGVQRKRIRFYGNQQYRIRPEVGVQRNHI